MLVSKRIIESILARADLRLGGSRPWDLQVFDERFYERVLIDGGLGLGESYVDGWWDCERLDEMICRGITHQLDDQLGIDPRVILSKAWLQFKNHQSIKKSRQVADLHYDLDDRLFENMLGPSMVYSCGYWRAAKDLDEAQAQKLELIRRKLEVSAGDRVLDIGCGWGSLARHLARETGCSVVGNTISEKQARYAALACHGLPIEIVVADYRSGSLRQHGRFDKIVSVGMFEHVGKKNYRRYMKLVHSLLKQSGLFLLHTIGINPRTGTDIWVDKYIFPNSALPSQRDIAEALEDLFIIEDWHNFGADYDKTLMAWYENLRRYAETPDSPYDKKFFRMFKYYLLSFAGNFRARNRFQLWQLVLSKRGVKGGYRSVR